MRSPPDCGTFANARSAWRWLAVAYLAHDSWGSGESVWSVTTCAKTARRMSPSPPQTETNALGPRDKWAMSPRFCQQLSTATGRQLNSYCRWSTRNCESWRLPRWPRSNRARRCRPLPWCTTPTSVWWMSIRPSIGIRVAISSLPQRKQCDGSWLNAHGDEKAKNVTVSSTKSILKITLRLTRNERLTCCRSTKR